MRRLGTAFYLKPFVWRGPLHGVVSELEWRVWFYGFVIGPLGIGVVRRERKL